MDVGMGVWCNSVIIRAPFLFFWVVMRGIPFSLFLMSSKITNWYYYYHMFGYCRELKLALLPYVWVL
jgi:hypothetical protein